MLIALWRIYPQYTRPSSSRRKELRHFRLRVSQLGNHLGFSLPYGTLTPKMVLKEWEVIYSKENPCTVTENTLSLALHY